MSRGGVTGEWLECSGGERGNANARLRSYAFALGVRGGSRTRLRGEHVEGGRTEWRPVEVRDERRDEARRRDEVRRKLLLKFSHFQ